MSVPVTRTRAMMRFSALQRAENSSIDPDDLPDPLPPRFSALQRAENSSILVSPQRDGVPRRFSALQRAENSSIAALPLPKRANQKFQCSSASRKFLNGAVGAGKRAAGDAFQCSSASRKFLNLQNYDVDDRHLSRFSALQRAENSSIQTLAPASIHISDRDDHASSFLSLPGASP